MSNWTGKDEETYLRMLDRLTDNAAADLERLRRKIERQDMAIEALRKKYQVNAQRRVFTPL
jgi:HPt (histidine-containing phosphotransfer) domain-containing protein